MKITPLLKMNKWSIIIPAALALLMIPGICEAAGEQLSGDDMVKKFIDLKLTGALFLFILGFLGGLISGFIGSGGLCSNPGDDEPGCPCSHCRGHQHVP